MKRRATKAVSRALGDLEESLIGPAPQRADNKSVKKLWKPVDKPGKPVYTRMV